MVKVEHRRIFTQLAIGLLSGHDVEDPIVVEEARLVVCRRGVVVVRCYCDGSWLSGVVVVGLADVVHFGQSEAWGRL